MDLAAAIADYEAATKAFDRAASAVVESELDNRHPDGWSARQVIHHVADSEAVSYVRLRRLLAEDNPTILAQDEMLWANSAALDYPNAPVDGALATLRATRAANLELLKRIKPADLARSGTHTEVGHYTVEDWLRNYTNHPLDHTEQLQRAVRGEA